MSSKIIKNNEYIREKIQACLKINNSSETMNDENLFLQQMESSLDEEYLSLDFIKQFKTYWNQNIQGI